METNAVISKYSSVWFGCVISLRQNDSFDSTIGVGWEKISSGHNYSYLTTRELEWVY